MTATTLVRIGDSLTGVLVAAYAVLAVIYATAGFWNKAAYWLGAAILTFGVLRMA